MEKESLVEKLEDLNEKISILEKRIDVVETYYDNEIEELKKQLLENRGTSTPVNAKEDVKKALISPVEGSKFRIERKEGVQKIQLYFSSIPSAEIRTILKQNYFYFDRKTKLWITNMKESRLKLVKEITLSSMLEEGE